MTTFIGKLFVMLNLAISLLMAAAAFGLYASGIDWTDRAAKEGQPSGKMQVIRKDIDDLLGRLFVAEGSWQAARADVQVREDVRREERAWTNAEMAKLLGGKDPVQMVEAAAPGANPADRPRMIAADFATNDPLMTREVYDERLALHQKENAKAREDLTLKVEEDTTLTRKLAGDKDSAPPLRGIRRELVEERDKRRGIVDEQGVTDSLEVNIGIESELILKRLDALDKRIQELMGYLKRKHKIDMPTRWR